MIVAEIGPFEGVDATTVAVYIAIGVVVMAAALLMAWSLMRAAKSPPPTALITALSMLTLFAIAGGIATSNDEAWTIAAAGMGALAGSVTSMFQEGRYKTLEAALAQKTIAEAEHQAVAEAAVAEVAMEELRDDDDHI